MVLRSGTERLAILVNGGMGGGGLRPDRRPGAGWTMLFPQRSKKVEEAPNRSPWWLDARSRFWSNERNPSRQDRHDGSGGLVAGRGDLPDLSAVLPRHERRRCGRPEGRHRAAGACRLARRGRRLAVAVLPIAHGGHGLRRFRLLRRRSDVRHPRRFRRLRSGSASPRSEGDDRPGAVAHLGPSRLVQESRLDRTNPKADWYVWADAKPDGTAPNNWLAIFGGPAWEWESGRKQYYMHNFLASQPDLNFHTRRCGRRCSTRSASGWTEAWTASGSTRSILFPRPSAARQPASDRDGYGRYPGYQSLRLSGPRLRQVAAGEPRIPARVPLAARELRCAHGGGRGG